MLKQFLAVLVFSITTPALSQTVFCLDRQSGQVDQAASQAFADMQSRMDPQLAQAIAGTWYSETNSPQTGQISRLQISYQANGGLERV